MKDWTRLVARKLRPSWVGPCMIVQILSPHKLLVQVFKGSTPFVVEKHVDQMLTCGVMYGNGGRRSGSV